MVDSGGQSQDGSAATQSAGPDRAQERVLRCRNDADLGSMLVTLNFLLGQVQQYFHEIPGSLEQHKIQLDILVSQMNALLSTADPGHKTPLFDSSSASELQGSSCAQVNPSGDIRQEVQADGSDDLLPFDQVLLRRHPSLSSAEIRVCRLVKRHLNISEIAERLAVKPATIKKHRSNIRHKIGLVQGQNLAYYLAALEIA